MKLKTIQLAILMAAINNAGLTARLIAQEIQEPESASAHIIGELTDGTPLPPESPKPGFIATPDEIISSQTFHQGGSKITIREILPIDLPEPPLPADTTIPNLTDTRAATTALEPAAPDQGLLFIGATIFIVKELQNPAFDGITNFAKTYCFSNNNRLTDMICAHEVGHYLNLSTEKKGQANAHDLGPWPEEMIWTFGTGSKGLMFGSAPVSYTPWMRRKDWVQANKSAKLKFK
jgi:hypothetical protein